MVDKCIVCKKKIINKYPKKGEVIQLEFSHSITTQPYSGMWDEMETEYLCGWDCYHKLKASHNRGKTK